MTQNLGNLFIDGESVIEDETGNHTITNHGVILNTSIKKHGNSSIYMYDVPTYITIPNSEDFEFGTDNFTVDWWENRIVVAPSYYGGISRDSESVYCPWLLGFGNKIYMTSTGNGWDIASGRSLGAQTYNVWNHCAVTRSNGTFYAFKNGQLTDTWYSSAALLANSNDLSIGRCQAGQQFRGYMDNIRIINGTALWTSNFAIDDDSLLYTYNFNRLATLYNTLTKGNIRGKAAEGFIRPTIKQFFTSEDFEDMIK